VPLPIVVPVPGAAPEAGRGSKEIVKLFELPPAAGSKLDLAGLRGAADKVLHTPGLHPQARRQLVMLAVSVHEAEEASLLHGRQSREVIEAIIGKFPESLQKPCRALLGAEDLSVSLRQSWRGKAPEFNTLHSQLTDVNEGSPKLAAGFRKALADKAAREGHPDLAQKLRDVKLEAGEGPRPPRQVAGDQILVLVPEAPPGSRAGQRPRPGQGLPDLDEEATVEFKHLRHKTGRALDNYVDFRNTLGHSSYHLARHAGRLVGSDDKEERKRRQQQHKDRLAQVASGLKRKLRPSEHLLVADMHDKPVGEIVKILAQPD
jgi:hypothetical protein